MRTISTALVALALIMTGCAGSSDDDAELQRSEQRVAELEAAAETTTTAEDVASTTAPPTTAASTTTPPSTAPPVTAAPVTAAPVTSAPTTVAPAPQNLMPNVVCMNLQAAQDHIQAEAGVFLSLSEDATGAGRSQIIDSNWVVVAQRPSVGTPIGEGDAVLSAVKLEEPNNC